MNCKKLMTAAAAAALSSTPVSSLAVFANEPAETYSSDTFAAAAPAAVLEQASRSQIQMMLLELQEKMAVAKQEVKDAEAAHAKAQQEYQAVLAQIETEQAPILKDQEAAKSAAAQEASQLAAEADRLQKAYEAATKAYEEAAAQVKEAESDLAEAEEAKKQADEDVAAFDKAHPEVTDEALNAAYADMNAAEAARKEADQALAAANKSVTDQQAVLAAHQAAADSTAAALATAQAEAAALQAQAAQAEAEYLTAQNRYDILTGGDEEQITELLAPVLNELQTAQAALTEAQNSQAVHEQTVLAPAQAANDQAQAALTEANATLATAQAEAAEKQLAYDTAIQALTDAQKTQDAVKADLDAAVAEEKELSEKKQTLQAKAAAADKAVQEAQNRLDEALKNLPDLDALRKAVEDAKAAYNQGSAGFFKYLADQGDADAKQAYAIITAKDGRMQNLSTEDYSGYTHLGEAGDATNLDNMKKAVDELNMVNEYRQKENEDRGYSGDNALKSLGVSSSLMAISQWQLNVSKVYFGHSQAFTVSENVSYGYPNPFTAWYVEEKENFDKQNGRETGHYENVVSPDYDAVGFSYIPLGQGNYPGPTYGQTFSYIWNGYDYGWNRFGKDAVSVSEYQSNFNTYYNKVYADIANAEKNLKDALAAGDPQVVIDNLRNQLAAARTAAAQAQEAFNTADEEHAAAVLTYKELNGKHQAAQQTKADAAKAVSEKKAALDAAARNSQAAAADAEKKAADAKTATYKLETANNEQTALKTAVSEAKALAAEKQSAYDKAATPDTEGLQVLKTASGQAAALSQEKDTQVTALQTDLTAKQALTDTTRSTLDKLNSIAMDQAELQIAAADAFQEAEGVYKGLFDLTQEKAGYELTAFTAQETLDQATEALASAKAAHTAALEKRDAAAVPVPSAKDMARQAADLHNMLAAMTSSTSFYPGPADYPAFDKRVDTIHDLQNRLAALAAKYKAVEAAAAASVENTASVHLAAQNALDTLNAQFTAVKDRLQALIDEETTQNRPLAVPGTDRETPKTPAAAEKPASKAGKPATAAGADTALTTGAVTYLVTAAGAALVYLAADRRKRA